MGRTEVWPDWVQVRGSAGAGPAPSGALAVTRMRLRLVQPPDQVVVGAVLEDGHHHMVNNIGPIGIGHSGAPSMSGEPACHRSESLSIPATEDTSRKTA